LGFPERKALNEVTLMKFAKYSLIVMLVFSSIGLYLACERATTLTFEGGPPVKFMLAGSGWLGSLRIGGPKKRREAFGETALLYWEIEPISADSVRRIEKISPIIYGKVPAGYRQLFPASGEPPPLIEGDTYNIRVSTNNAPGIIKDFTIRDGKVIEAP
jgi:hypothetical protein